VKVGDLVLCEWYGRGVILEMFFGEAKVHFVEGSIVRTLDKHEAAELVVLSESR
jgi:hypothetical protein